MPRMMDHLISVCIPTCRRPQLLKEAIASCLAQTYRPLEVLVGDDSEDDRSASVVNLLQNVPGVTIDYHRNHTPLGQAGNVNDLFDRARGDRIVLLHDDDLLLPDAIETLSNCWVEESNLTASFGKQYIISVTGEINQSESEYLNKLFFRTPDKAGLQPSALESALLQQFPNDGFLIRSDIAKRVRLREHSKVGDAVDFDFGIRVARESEGGFYFVDKYTCKYRNTPDSVNQSAQSVEYMFPQIQRLEVPAHAEGARNVALRRMAPFYVKYLAIKRKRGPAFQVLFGEYFDRRLLYSRKGLILFAQIIAPSLDPMLQKIGHRMKAQAESTRSQS